MSTSISDAHNSCFSEIQVHGFPWEIASPSKNNFRSKTWNALLIYSGQLLFTCDKMLHFLNFTDFFVRWQSLIRVKCIPILTKLDETSV